MNRVLLECVLPYVHVQYVLLHKHVHFIVYMFLILLLRFWKDSLLTVVFAYSIISYLSLHCLVNGHFCAEICAHSLIYKGTHTSIHTISPEGEGHLTPHPETWHLRLTEVTGATVPEILPGADLNIVILS